MIDRSALEVLAPGGDYGRLKAAVDFGADAVYVGGSGFSMRTACDNFTPEELRRGVRYAHEHGAKCYLTVNTLPTNAEIAGLPELLQQAQDAAVDALIVADMGVLGLAKKYAPGTAIHCSTQMGVMNYETARMLWDLGAERIVLARELTLEEIAEIRAKTPPQLVLEGFVHGAMCVSFSGRCLLSRYLTDRDANRGRCAQPCRWKYALMEEKRPGQYFPVEEDGMGTYIMNSNDLCCIEFLDRLAEAGITSFKIEGRSKTAVYTALVTNAYYHAVRILRSGGEYVLPEWLRQEVFKVSHRRYCPGFYLGADKLGYNYDSGGYERDYEAAGIVTATTPEGITVLSQRNRFYKDDILEGVAPKAVPRSCAIRSMRDENGDEIDVAPHPMQTVYADLGTCFPVGTVLRRAVR